MLTHLCSEPVHDENHFVTAGSHSLEARRSNRVIISAVHPQLACNFRSHCCVELAREPPMKLKLTELASIAEIIGAFAVVISLIYVGVQVNDSASAVRSASANDANVALQSWYMQIGSDQQTSELFYEALTSEEALSNQEEFQFLMMFHGIFLALQNSFLLAEEGTIDVELREGLTSVILGVKELPGFRRYWRQRRSYLHPEFAEYVDQLLTHEADGSVDIYRIPEVNPEDE